MDIALQQMVYASVGLVQAIILTALWIVVYVRTRHRGVWFFIPILPLVGFILVPVVVGAFYMQMGMGQNGAYMMSILISVFTFLFLVAPLLVLVVRLLNGKIRIGRDGVADVFGE